MLNQFIIIDYYQFIIIDYHLQTIGCRANLQKQTKQDNVKHIFKSNLS